MVITFASKLQLKHTWWSWKFDSKLHNFVFDENFPIQTFSSSKRALKRRQKIWTDLLNITRPDKIVDDYWAKCLICSAYERAPKISTS